ncbi:MULTISPECIES: hypothetical protein [Vibrio]|uniref:GIY-YIG domain-containing protein n=3 Tax=Vibrio TaxID=662 RepID=A0A1E5CWF9_9VIBR|nr:hypothetical protein [Vibrio genomosp. F6]OEE74709.1 hypothetical protein A130_17725 [Vibrio genomosp. F6 str. FF-238]
MNIDNIKMLPNIITETSDLESQFKDLFGSSEASNAKSVIYFFRSVRPVPRLRGESDILYIGKTKQSIKGRYLQYAKHLATGSSGCFYRYIIDNYGGLRLGFVIVDNPNEMEKYYFKEYRAAYLENPPKSKVG